MLHTSPRRLARPHIRAHFQLNRDVDKDGTVDIALMSTFSGGVAGAGGYECEYQDSAGQTASLRADTGSVWFKANSQRSYRTRWRTINWVNLPGPWSSYTSYITPSPQTGAPSAPSSGSITPVDYGFVYSWSQPSELDYSHSEIAVLFGSPGAPSDSDCGWSVKFRYGYIYFPHRGASNNYFYCRHVNTSGLKSGWSLIGSGDSAVVDYIAAGAGGATAVNNLGTSLSGSVNAGAAASTLLICEWKCTSNTAGVTVTLGSKSQIFDFADQQPFTMISRENGGGSFSVSKSGGGSQSGAELVAIALT